MVANPHALITVSIRYYNVRKQAACQSVQVLFNKLIPIDIPIRSLSCFAYIVNVDTVR